MDDQELSQEEKAYWNSPKGKAAARQAMHGGCDCSQKIDDQEQLMEIFRKHHDGLACIKRDGGICGVCYECKLYNEGEEALEKLKNA